MATVNETIKLVIRTTNSKCPDLSIEMTSSASISEPKQHITLDHAMKPIPKNQRLIYSGKLLDDKCVLSQVFIKSTSGSSLIIHLVLDSDKNETFSIPPQQTTVKFSTDSKESWSVSSHSDTYEQYMNTLNKYQQELQQYMVNPYGNRFTPNFETQPYLQCCYTHYHSYQNYLTHPRLLHTITSIRPASNQPISVVSPPPVTNNNEFAQENNLFGTSHLILKVFLLCSIIYFYSTSNRFLLIVALFALLYLHCRGFLIVQQRRHALVQQIPPEVEQAAAAGGNDLEQRINEDIETEQIQNTDDIQLQESPPSGAATDNQITPIRLLLTAVSTFFSSLIPERPQRA